MNENSKKKVEDLKKMLEGKKGQKQEPPETKAPTEETLPELKELTDKLAVLEEEAKKYEEEAKQNHEKLLRALADFDNYKKRVARDHEDRAKYAHELLVKELLPVLDDFDRILEHLPAESSPAIQSLIEGVELTHRHFMTVMKKLGLHAVETIGKKFDPHFHEALSQIPSKEHEEGNIISS